jgi:hypothetical protein
LTLDVQATSVVCQPDSVLAKRWALSISRNGHFVAIASPAAQVLLQGSELCFDIRYPLFALDDVFATAAQEIVDHLHTDTDRSGQFVLVQILE